MAAAAGVEGAAGVEVVAVVDAAAVEDKKEWGKRLQIVVNKARRKKRECKTCPKIIVLYI